MKLPCVLVDLNDVFSIHGAVVIGSAFYQGRELCIKVINQSQTDLGRG